MLGEKFLITRERIIAMIAALKAKGVDVVEQSGESLDLLVARAKLDWAKMIEQAHTADKIIRTAYRQGYPQPRTRSHAGAHYPRHATNAKSHFAHKSGMGPREMHRRRVGNLGAFRKEAEAWLN